jgi:hypothetical protein
MPSTDNNNADQNFLKFLVLNSPLLLFALTVFNTQPFFYYLVQIFKILLIFLMYVQVTVHLLIMAF